jgi:hypothetical protein
MEISYVVNIITPQIEMLKIIYKFTADDIFLCSPKMAKSQSIFRSSSDTVCTITVT